MNQFAIDWPFLMIEDSAWCEAIGDVVSITKISNIRDDLTNTSAKSKTLAAI